MDRDGEGDAEGGAPHLGPWELRRLIGRGGMGAVYQAVEPRTGTWAAVKVLSPGHHATRDQAAESLVRELDAVRLLSHPHVVRLLGHGRVRPEEARAGGGELGDEGFVEGTRWLAMELVSGARRPSPRSWEACRAVLKAVLGALAHAHAHRVLHLDLKPDNVLVQDEPQGLRIRLGDFGMAATSAGDGLVRVRGGTIAYMAPEQLRMDPRRVGPATDLYALGCLATALVTGFPPFRGPSARIRSAHLHRTPPLLQPRFDVPAGLQAWVDRLLEKAPEDRFPTAAHAAAALDELGPVEEGSAFGLTGHEGSTTTFSFETMEDSAPSASMGGASGLVSTLPCPPSPPPVAVPGAPTGLLVTEEGPPPLPDDPAVRALWSDVGRLRSGGVRIVRLVGPEGVGVLAVARATARLAGEHGLADHLELYPDLARTLRRWTRCTGLEGHALQRHLAALPRVLSALESGDDLEAAVIEAVRHRTRRLPVVLVAPVGTGTASLLDALAALDVPLLVLVLHPDGAPVPDGVPVVAVRPAPGGVERRLRAWVQLDPAVAAQVEERSGGCARLAVALLAEARRTGAVQGEQLLSMADGVAVLPPVALPGARSLLDGLGLDPPALRSLALSALAPEPPGGPIWQRARADLELPDPGAAPFEAARLPEAIDPERGWRPAVRESLRAVVHDDPSLHRALAPHAPEGRRGLHLLLAGEPDAAGPLLLEAAERDPDDGGLARVHHLLHAHAVAAARSPDGFPAGTLASARLLEARTLARRGQAYERVLTLVAEVVGVDPALDPLALALRAHGLATLGRSDEALAAVADTLACPVRDVDALRAALRVRFIVQRRREDLDGAAATLDDLRELAEVEQAVGEWHHAAGLLAAERGRFEEAVTHLDRAAAILQAAGSDTLAASAWNISAAMLRATGRLDEAEERLVAAREAGHADPLRELRFAQIALVRGVVDPMRAARDRLRSLPGLNGAQLRILRLMDLPLAAAEPDEGRWRDALEHARHCLAHRLERGELPWSLEQAALLAGQAGYGDRAAAAAELAGEAWMVLHRPDDAARARAHDVPRRLS